MSAKVVVAIEARVFSPEAAGGVSQVIMSIAQNLSRLGDGEEEYVFIGWDGAQDWLGKFISGPCRLHLKPRKAWKDRVAKSAVGPALLKLQQARRSLMSGRSGNADIVLAQSDGTAESLGANVVHFPSQAAYLVDTPSIYHPHDLQHLHMPELFDTATLRWRAAAYQAFCQRAKYVAVESSWMKRDVAQKIGIAQSAIAVCPILPPTLPEPDAIAMAAARKMADFEEFIFYPAQTWPHKNHLRLIEALGFLKKRFGMVVPLVCTGRKNEHFAKIAAAIDSEGLNEQIRFLNYVSDVELAAIYRMSTAVVIPTLFESLSLPMWEAFAAGVPVASSTVTALPEQLAGAGLLFDPRSTESLALAVRQLWESEALRAEFARKGAERLNQFSSMHMVRHIRALYRSAIGKGVNEEDATLLQAPALI